MSDVLDRITVRRQGKVELVAAQLRAAIAAGALPPGSRLRMPRLAQELGTSRTTVSAALWVLRSEGLVEKREGRQWRVPGSSP